MKNKKILIIAIVIIVLCAVIFSVNNILSRHLFNADGTLSDGRLDLINRLRSVENTEERARQIDFSLEHNIITQKEANELY